jgi:hypothetical protein
MKQKLRNIFVISLASAGLALCSSALAANFTVVGPSYNATVSLNQVTVDITNLELSGYLETDFVLIGSDGTNTYSANGTINLTGPSGLSFSQAIVDTGCVPVRSGSIFKQCS